MKFRHVEGVTLSSGWARGHRGSCDERSRRTTVTALGGGWDPWRLWSTYNGGPKARCQVTVPVVDELSSLRNDFSILASRLICEASHSRRQKILFRKGRRREGRGGGLGPYVPECTPPAPSSPKPAGGELRLPHARHRGTLTRERKGGGALYGPSRACSVGAAHVGGPVP